MAVGAGALDEGAEAAPEVGHVVEDHLRHEGGPVADGVRDGEVAVVRVDLHRLHDPLRRRVDQLRVAARVAVVALAELAARVLLEDWKWKKVWITLEVWVYQHDLTSQFAHLKLPILVG